jgi:hypothetical protein
MNHLMIYVMRKITVIVLLMVALIASNCSSENGKNSANSSLSVTGKGTSEIAFREYQHNFGKVKEGEKISYIFTFENKGKSDLIVSSATTSCGCTVPKFDKKPIAPGANGNLEVIFDTSGRDGMQTKIITVKSNSLTPVVLLKITAEVVTTDK